MSPNTVSRIVTVNLASQMCKKRKVSLSRRTIQVISCWVNYGSLYSSEVLVYFISLVKFVCVELFILALMSDVFSDTLFQILVICVFTLSVLLEVSSFLFSISLMSSHGFIISVFALGLYSSFPTFLRCKLRFENFSLLKNILKLTGKNT